MPGEVTELSEADEAIRVAAGYTNVRTSLPTIGDRCLVRFERDGKSIDITVYYAGPSEDSKGNWTYHGNLTVPVTLAGVATHWKPNPRA